MIIIPKKSGTEMKDIERKRGRGRDSMKRNKKKKRE